MNKFKSNTNKILLSSFVTIISLVMFISPVFVSAQEVALNISMNKVVRNATPGHIMDISEVPEAFIGRTCSVKAEGENNSSVHPGNDLTITSSNGSAVVLKDVEREKNAITEADGKLILGDEVKVTLSAVGQSKTFSGGFDVSIICPVPAPEPTPVPEVKPEKPATPTQVLSATVLPVTGSGSIISLLVGVGVFGSFAHATVTRKR